MANGDPLAGLKDFQRRTVEYVFRRLYLDPEPTRRFLVADEAGLGKTMVARGIIARTVRHLQAKGTPRIDIVYVCSNADIARQNVERLNTSGQPAFVEASRLTLLPLHVARLDEHPLNFISFTPGTTFSLGQRTGTKEERRLLYHLLLPLADISAKGLARLLQGFAGPTWFETIKQPLMMTVDAAITAKFRQALLAADADYAQLRAACTLRHDGRRSLDAKQQEQGWTIIGKLRQRLAYCCLDVLEPDLVILDEFSVSRICSASRPPCPTQRKKTRPNSPRPYFIARATLASSCSRPRHTSCTPPMATRKTITRTSSKPSPFCWTIARPWRR